MDRETYNTLRANIEKSLATLRLGDALRQVTDFSERLGRNGVSDELEGIRENYKMLLHYMSQGVADPQRQNMFRNFLQQVQGMASALFREQELREGTSHYAVTWRTNQKIHVPESLSELLEEQTSLRTCFEGVWTSSVWKKADSETAAQALSSEVVSTEKKCMLLSAAMLGALTFFDAEKLRFLVGAMSAKEPLLQARAIVGTVFVAAHWRGLSALYPELSEQLLTACSEERMTTALTELQLQLLVSLDTPKIEQRIRRDIVPEIMKGREIEKLSHSGLNMEELGEELNNLAANPEWEKTNELIMQKISDFKNLAERGADVYMGSFKMLKQMFPFFSVAANWFAPFSINHPDVPASLRSNALLSLMNHAGHLCDSDKFSLCLFLEKMSAEQKGMGVDIIGKMKEMMSEMGGDSDLAVKEEATSLHGCLRTYVMDTYRFFKLFRYKDEAVDPFNGNLLLVDTPPFDIVLSGDKSVKAMADFSFEIEAYAWALRFYRLTSPTAETMQKTGYCYQLQHEYESAAAAYEHARLLGPESDWTTRQLANCYKRMGTVDKALALYVTLEEKHPEDEKLLLLLGECLLRKGNYDEALKKYFKAYYLYPDNNESLRAIAWCCLQANKVDEAGNHYEKLLTLRPNANDYVNAGHAAWIKGDVAKAVDRYLKGIKVSEGNIRIERLFEADAVFLHDYGITTEDVNMMTDILKAKTEQ